MRRQISVNHRTVSELIGNDKQRIQTFLSSCRRNVLRNTVIFNRGNRIAHLWKICVLFKVSDVFGGLDHCCMRLRNYKTLANCNDSI